MKSTIAVVILVVLSAVAGSAHGQYTRRKSNREKYSDVNIEEVCEDRPSREYFRLSTEGNCGQVVRCDQAASAASGLRLAELKCPQSLAFDLQLQTCDWKDNVKNCDVLSKPRKSLPNLVTDEPVCPDGELQCGDGVCMAKLLFCDGKVDCADGSDENACTVTQDPNRAPRCNLADCVLPDCFCSADGTVIPGASDTSVEQTPQMVTVSFNGAVTGTNMAVYQSILTKNHINPNGCTAKATFFVSHKYSNYSAVQELHRQGHEIAAFSITTNDEEDYWLDGSYDDWLAEMAGARLIIERFAGISDGSVIGMRAPRLLVGANRQFEMMVDQFFAYDSSITVPLDRKPVWPYTLHYLMPHKCSGNHGNCPSRSHAVWELPINELDRREDPTFDEKLTGCALVSACSNVYTKEHFKSMLQTNLRRHYESNRAPMSLSFDAAWLESVPDFAKTLGEWMGEVMEEFNDVYFVTNTQVIQWMQNPVPMTGIRDFEEWKTSCAPSGQPLCSLPNPCPVNTRELPGETLRLHTCQECPKKYPWILDPTGDGFSFKG